MTFQERGMAVIALTVLNAALWVPVALYGFNPLLVAPAVVFTFLSAVALVRVAGL